MDRHKKASPGEAGPSWQLDPGGLTPMAAPSGLLPLSTGLQHRWAIRAPEDLRLIRTELRERFLQLGYAPDRAARMVVAVNEITTNALRHGGGGMCGLRLDERGTYVQVTNSAPGFDTERVGRLLNRSRHSGTWDGFGLRIAATYADRMAVTPVRGEVHVVLYFANDRLREDGSHEHDHTARE